MHTDSDASSEQLTTARTGFEGKRKRKRTDLIAADSPRGEKPTGRWRSCESLAPKMNSSIDVDAPEAQVREAARARRDAAAQCLQLQLQLQEEQAVHEFYRQKIQTLTAELAVASRTTAMLRSQTSELQSTLTNRVSTPTRNTPKSVTTFKTLSPESSNRVDSSPARPPYPAAPAPAIKLSPTASRSSAQKSPHASNPSPLAQKSPVAGTSNSSVDEFLPKRLFEQVYVVGSAQTDMPVVQSASAALDYWARLNGETGRPPSTWTEPAQVLFQYPPPSALGSASLHDSLIAAIATGGQVGIHRIDPIASQSHWQSSLFARSPFSRGAHVHTALIRTPEATSRIEHAARLRRAGSASAASEPLTFGDAIRNNFSEFMFAVCLKFDETSSRYSSGEIQSGSNLSPQSSRRRNANRARQHSQVGAPLTLVLVSRLPFFSFHLDFLAALFGCHRLTLLSLVGGDDLSALGQLDLLDVDDHSNRIPSWIRGLQGKTCRSTVGMWHTLAELVYNTTIPGIGEQVRINLPPLLRAHLDALVVQRPLSLVDEWTQWLGDWAWAPALHCLQSVAQFSLLLTALLLEVKVLVLDLPSSKFPDGDAFLTTASVITALSLLAPLKWAGKFAMSAVAPSHADLLSAPGAFLAGLLYSHYRSSVSMVGVLQEQLELSSPVAEYMLNVPGDGSDGEVLSELPDDCVVWLPLQRRLLVSPEFSRCTLLSRKKFCTALEPLFELLRKDSPIAASAYAPCHQPSAQQTAAARAIVHSVFKYNVRLVECASRPLDTDSQPSPSNGEREANKLFLQRFKESQAYVHYRDERGANSL